MKINKRDKATRTILRKYTTKEAAEILGVSRSAVYQALAVLGMEPGKRPRWFDDAEICSLVGVLSDGEVAERAGVAKSSVRQWRIRQGIEATQPAFGRRKELSVELEVALDGQDTHASIAREFGLTPAQIRGYRITRGWVVRDT